MYTHTMYWLTCSVIFKLNNLHQFVLWFVRPHCLMLWYTCFFMQQKKKKQCRSFLILLGLKLLGLPVSFLSEVNNNNAYMSCSQRFSSCDVQLQDSSYCFREVSV